MLVRAFPPRVDHGSASRTVRVRGARRSIAAVALAASIVSVAPGPVAAVGGPVPAVAASAVGPGTTPGATPPDTQPDTPSDTQPDTQPDTPSDGAPPVSYNDFLPEDRDISDCVSAVPKPGCGSKARGGWRLGLVAIALVLGLSFIGWRIVRGARRPAVSAPRTPGATTAPTDRDGGRGS